ncbi:MAG: MoxR family ATPase, partial [Lachnospiraceae bacterium]|nr:MoxR family ATPase [Lachnospiraceae bacterium]
HILLEDVPGLGKTTLAKAFSKALGFENKRIQFTPDTMPSDIVGMSIYNEQTNAFEYVEGAAVHCNLLLGDEINRTSSKTQSALLEAMAEGRVTVDGVTHVLMQPFVVMATQNPITSGGTQALPDSQLDRFMIRLSMGYPDAESQLAILQNVSEHDIMEPVQAVMTAEQVTEMQRFVKNMQVQEDVLRYMIALCEQTRNHPYVELGISPRGVGALAEMSKSYAVCQGRAYVVPEDVQAVFVDVCAHRLILNTKARRENISAQSILEQIMEQVDRPKLLRK